LPLVAEQTLRVDGGYRFDERWNFGLEYQWVGATVFGGDFANQLDKLPSYQVVNAHLHWQYQHWEARLRVNNLLNEKYSESGSQYTEYHPVTFAPSYYESFFPSAERNLWLSVSYSFE
jgi:outer membrane receptor protein involved in Fe transport